MSEKHQFALYTPDLTQLNSPELFHRAVRVLRLTTGAQVILFNRTQQVLAELTQITKNSCNFKLLGQPVFNIILAPEITVLLPLLKREALETALYSCVELGANKVQLVITAKSEPANKFNAGHLARLEKIMYAAAEQSKNFALPELLAPVSLTKLLAQSCSLGAVTKIFFDVTGQPAPAVLANLNLTTPLWLLWGPEGDLTSAEKTQILAVGFKFCKLTPTVLRASQAVALGLGLVRVLNGPGV